MTTLAERGGGQRVRRPENDEWREGWTWRRPIAVWFRDELQRIDLPRPVLHLCSGSSTLGSIRVDRYHPNATIKADAFRLPFKDHSFGTVVYDGPYDWSLQQRLRVCQEMARVTRYEGRLLWKQRFRPLRGLFRIDEEWVVDRRVGMPRDVDLLIRATRRTPGPNAGRTWKKRALRGVTAVSRFRGSGREVGRCVTCACGRRIPVKRFVGVTTVSCASCGLRVANPFQKRSVLR